MKTIRLLLLLAALPSFAQETISSPGAPGAPSAGFSGREKNLRVRAGLLGGMVMQKPQFSLGVAYDAARLGKLFRLVLDFTFGLRANEVTLEPMIGVRLPLPIQSVPRLDLYAQALVGANLTFMRGGTAMALPVRLGAGATFEVTRNFGLGAELSYEMGPLVLLFTWTYAALHFSLMAGWAI